MSYSFTAASSHYLSASNSVLQACPIGMLCWVKSGSTTLFQVAMGIANSASNTKYARLSCAGNATDDPVHCSVVCPDGAPSASTNGYPTSSWGMIGGTVHGTNTTDPALRLLYSWLNGASKGSGSGSVSFDAASLNIFGIGASLDSTPGPYFEGLIAECAWYDLESWGGGVTERNDAFEAAMADMVANALPPIAYPTGLVAYQPLRAALNEANIGPTFSASGATPNADHPALGGYPGGLTSGHLIRSPLVGGRLAA